MFDQDRHRFDPLSTSFLIVILFLTGYGLESTGWLTELNRVTVLIILGGVFGLLLGQTRFSRKATFWLGLIITIEFISWQLIFSSPLNITWIEKYRIFSERLSRTMEQVFTNQPLTDGILFVVGMSILYWIIGFGSGLSLIRHGKLWLFILSAGLAIFIVQLFQPSALRNQLLTASFCILSLLLLARQRYLSIHLEWQAAALPEDQSIFPVTFRIAFTVTFVAVLIAWFSPLVMRIVTPGSKEQMEFSQRMADVWQTGKNLFAPLKQRANNREGVIGNILTLTATRSLGTDLIFSIKASSPNQSGIQYYWKGRIFEKYQGGIWQNGETFEETLPKDTIINKPFETNATTIKFSIIPASDQFQLYYPTQPVSIDKKITLLKLMDQNPDEIVAIFPNQVNAKGEIYLIISSLRNFYLTNFPAIDEVYPTGMQNTYLQLPSIDLSRIRALANAITEGKTGILEKVQAVTQYLRNNFAYSDTLSDLPYEKTDLVEWFLFSNKSGFCTYFASAEVILLRTLGIPSRLVVGYSQGTMKNGGVEFEIHEKDNHAWPEVYFNKIGWVPFEPTPSQPNIDYEILQSKNASMQNDSAIRQPNSDLSVGGLLRLNKWEMSNEIDLYAPPSQNQPKLAKPDLFPIALMIGFIFISFIWLFRSRVFYKKSLPAFIGSQINRMGFSPTPNWLLQWDIFIQKSQIERIFLFIDWMLLFLGKKIHSPLSARQKILLLVQMVPTCQVDAWKILNQYEMEKYSDKKQDVKKARKTIWRIWFQVFKTRIRNRFDLT